MRKPKVGDIGTNESNLLGLVTRVVIIEGETQYEGVQLTNNKFPIGGFWLGRSVRVHGQAEDVVENAWKYQDLL